MPTRCHGCCNVCGAACTNSIPSVLNASQPSEQAVDGAHALRRVVSTFACTSNVQKRLRQRREKKQDSSRSESGCEELSAHTPTPTSDESSSIQGHISALSMMFGMQDEGDTSASSTASTQPRQRDKRRARRQSLSGYNSSAVQSKLGRQPDATQDANDTESAGMNSNDNESSTMPDFFGAFFSLKSIFEDNEDDGSGEDFNVFGEEDTPADFESRLHQVNLGDVHAIVKHEVPAAATNPRERLEKRRQRKCTIQADRPGQQHT